MWRTPGGNVSKDRAAKGGYVGEGGSRYRCIWSEYLLNCGPQGALHDVRAEDVPLEVISVKIEPPSEPKLGERCCLIAALAG